MVYVILLYDTLLAGKACPFTFLQYKPLPALFLFVAYILQKSAAPEVSKSFFLKIPW